MGDDPIIPVEMHAERGSANATGGSIHYHVGTFGKTGTVVMVVSIGLALGLAIGAVVIVSFGQSVQREQARIQAQATERRLMDRASLAEREARIAVDKIEELRLEVSKR